MSLLTNTTKLNELKNKANNLPDQNPPAQLQEKTVTPTKEGLSVAPDSGFDGLSKVTVNGDNNLVPENIKEGVSIFGVEGSNAGGDLGSLNYTYIRFDESLLTYTDLNGGIQTITLPRYDYNKSANITDIDFSKDITWRTNPNSNTGYEIKLSISDGTVNLGLRQRGIAPP